MALERLLPESLLDDLLLRLEAAHLLHAQHQAELVELGRQQHLQVFYPNSILKLSVEFVDKKYLHFCVRISRHLCGCSSLILRRSFLKLCCVSLALPPLWAPLSHELCLTD